MGFRVEHFGLIILWILCFPMPLGFGFGGWFVCGLDFNVSCRIGNTGFGLRWICGFVVTWGGIALGLPHC